MRALLLAGGLGLIGTLLGTRWAIAILVKQGYGQLIRDDGPTSHHTKRGTPTMGGPVIILAVLFGYFGAKLLLRDAPSASALLLLFLFVGLGAVGLRRRLHQDLQAAQPRPAQQGEVRRPDRRRGRLRVLTPAVPGRPGQRPGVAGDLVHPRVSTGSCRPILVIIWVLIMIAGTSNAVNLTDGLDGLATGSSMMVFGAYTLVGIWQNNQFCAITARTAVLQRGPRPARPGGRGGRAHRRLLRLPVVERVAGQDLHGRHRVAVARRRDGRASRS